MTLPIVVPLDGSAVSERALVQGIAIARALGSELHLVRVSNAGTSKRGPWLLPYSTRADIARFFVEERRREQEYLDAIANRIREQFGEADATALLDGPVAKAIVKYSLRQKARLIVMTTHGSSGIGGMPLGTVADKVARLGGLPVLLIRPDGSDINRTPIDWRCERILVPLDGSELAQRVLEQVTLLGLAMVAEVTLVSIVNPGTRIDFGYPSVPLGGPLEATNPGTRAAEAHLSLVAQHLRHSGLRVATRVVCGSWHAAEAIIAVARDLDADLIAIATRGRGCAMRLAFGSVAGSLLRTASRPVLVLRPMDVSNERPDQDSVHTTDANVEQPVSVHASTVDEFSTTGVHT